MYFTMYVPAEIIAIILRRRKIMMWNEKIVFKKWDTVRFRDICSGSVSLYMCVISFNRIKIRKNIRRNEAFYSMSVYREGHYFLYEYID